MILSLEKIEGNTPYQAFLNYIKSPKTLKDYVCYLRMFLDSIPSEIYKNNSIEYSNDSLEANATSFIELAKSNDVIVKNIIGAYVTELKKMESDKIIKPATLRSRMKPIKALLASNEIPFFWKNLNRGMPKPGKGEDRAYTRDELKLMIRMSNVMDKVIVTLFSSAGFRLAAWDDFIWDDVRFFTNPDGTSKGLGIRVYRGDVEEYWTHGTPEAANYLLAYREDWNSRFGNYPKITDPLMVAKNAKMPNRLSARGVSSRMTDLTTKCGLRPTLEKGKKRHAVMADHGFRKYCNTMMRRAKVDFADKEDMQGRNIGQEASYERYEEGDFERWPEYQKAIPFLTISEEERAIAKIALKEQEITELEEKNQELENKENENEVLRDTLVKHDVILEELLEEKRAKKRVKPSPELEEKMLDLLREHNLI